MTWFIMISLDRHLISVCHEQQPVELIHQGYALRWSRDDGHAVARWAPREAPRPVLSAAGAAQVET